jgi:hypothetical protein
MLCIIGKIGKLKGIIRCDKDIFSLTYLIKQIKLQKKKRNLEKRNKEHVILVNVNGKWPDIIHKIHVPICFPFEYQSGEFGSWFATECAQ